MPEITLPPQAIDAAALRLIFETDGHAAPVIPVVADEAIPIHTADGPRGVYFVDLRECTPEQRTKLLAYFGHKREALEKTTSYLLNQSLPILVIGGDEDAT